MAGKWRSTEGARQHHADLAGTGIQIGLCYDMLCSAVEGVIRCEVPPVSYREAPVIMGPAWLSVRNLYMGQRSIADARTFRNARPNRAATSRRMSRSRMRRYVNSQSVPETGSNRPFTSFNPRLGDLCTRRQATGITLLWLRNAGPGPTLQPGANLPLLEKHVLLGWHWPDLLLPGLRNMPMSMSNPGSPYRSPGEQRLETLECPTPGGYTYGRAG